MNLTETQPEYDTTTGGVEPDDDGDAPEATEATEVTDGEGNPLLVDVPAELEPDRPPLIDEQGRVRLSFSRIDTYRTCPRMFRYRYIDRLPGKPAPALSFGSSIHEALERFYDRKLPEEPTEEELVGFLYDAWDTSGFREVGRDEQTRWYRQGQQVLRRYHQRVTGSYQLPVATEAWFELPFENAVVVGSIDRVDDDDGVLRVVDYKTNKRVKSRDRVKQSLQLSIYALACEHLYGQLPATVALDFVVAGREIVVDVDELDLDAARSAITETAEAIRAEAFEPTPMRLCDWCDFRAACPAWEGQDGSQVLGPAVTELAQLRRSVQRDVARLRALEDGVERLRRELAEREQAEQEGIAVARSAADEASGADR